MFYFVVNIDSQSKGKIRIPIEGEFPEYSPMHFRGRFDGDIGSDYKITSIDSISEDDYKALKKSGSYFADLGKK